MEHGQHKGNFQLSRFRSPLKSLGQNFLIDRNVIDKIVQSAQLLPDDNILEIGPGRGALTSRLIEEAGNVLLVEYDHALAADLQQKYLEEKKVTVIDGDILAVNLSALLSGKDKWKVVANLPYNISTEVLFRLMDVRASLSRMVLMLQKEVGDRLVARPDCSDYGVTTVLLGLWFDIRREFLVPPGCFNPPPKVDSAVLSFVPLPRPRVEVGSEEIFRRVVKGAFSMRRKTLYNCLKNAALADTAVTGEILNQCGIDGQRRGETLSLEEFAALSRKFSSRMSS